MGRILVELDLLSLAGYLVGPASTPTLFADLRSASHLESIVSSHKSLIPRVSTMVLTSILVEFGLLALLITNGLSK